MRKLFLQTAALLTMAACTGDNLNQNPALPQAGSNDNGKDKDPQTEMTQNASIWDDTIAVKGNVLFHAHNMAKVDDTIEYFMASDSSLMKYSDNNIHTYAVTLLGETIERDIIDIRAREKYNFNDNTYTVISIQGERGVPLIHTEDMRYSLPPSTIEKKRMIRDSLLAPKGSPIDVPQLDF